MDGTVWRKTTLFAAMSGLAIRTASELALPPFLASAHACQGFVSQILPQFDVPDYLQGSTEK